MTSQASSCDLKELVLKFIPEAIGRDIEKATAGIYPLQNVFIRKVKILKAPKFDLGKLMEVCILIHTLLSPSFWSWRFNFQCLSITVNFLNSLLTFLIILFRFMVTTMKT